MNKHIVLMWVGMLRRKYPEFIDSDRSMNILTEQKISLDELEYIFEKEGIKPWGDELTKIREKKQ